MADSIVYSVNGPLSIIDMERRIIYVNKHGLDLCKLSLEDAVGTLYSNTSIYPANSEYCPITALKAGRETEAYYLEENGRY
jgi:PAS domain-containing protein